MCKDTNENKLVFLDNCTFLQLVKRQPEASGFFEYALGINV